jgi:hypothetical protein
MKLLVLLVGTFVLGSSACRTGGSNPELGPLAVSAGRWNEDDGAAEGTVALEGQCFVLDTGQSKLLLVFAREGTSWDAATRTARTDHRTLRTGAAVTVGGGGGTTQGIEWHQPPDNSCAKYPVWFLNNN